jgi:hypothetical protein
MANENDVDELPPAEWAREGADAHAAMFSERFTQLDKKYGLDPDTRYDESTFPKGYSDECEALVDTCLIERNVRIVEKNGVTAFGFRDRRFPLLNWHAKAFAMKDVNGNAYGAVYMDGRDYVTSFHEEWLSVKYLLVQWAFWEPMTEQELDELGLFKDRQLPDDRNSLITRILEAKNRRALL